MNPAQLLSHFNRIGEAPDAIPRLRKFILELAYRGKLVPQRQVEGTGEELLKAIKSAHPSDRKFGGRAKEGKATLDPLNCPGIAEVPSTWRWSYLDFICEQISDVDHKMPKAVNDGVPFISARDLKDDGTIDILNAKRISEDDYLRLSRKVQMRRGDIVYSRIGTIGKARLVTSDIRFIISYSCCLVRPLKGHLDVRYLQLFLESRMALNQAHKSTQGIGVPDLGLGEIKQFKVPLPPLAEQHRIVAKVDELMGLCDRLEAAQTERESRRDRLVASSLYRLNNGADPDAFREHARFYFNHLPRLTTRTDHIKQLRQTILNLAVRGKLVPQDPTDEPASELLKRIQTERARLEKAGEAKAQKQHCVDTDIDMPFNIPKTWLWISLGDIAFGLRYGTSVKCSFEPTEHPVLRIPNVDNGRVNIENLKFGTLSAREAADLQLQLGDILLVRSNGSLNLVGRPALVEAHAVGFCYAGYLVRVRTSVIHLDSRYLLLALNTTHIRDQIEIPIRSTVGLKNVNATELSRLSLPLPPLSEQKRIVTKVDELMALCDQLETQLTTTQSESRHLLKAVLHEALAKGTEKG